MISERAAARVGEEVLILIEDAGELEGRAAHQGPEVDGSTRIVKGESDVMIGEKVTVGSYIRGEVIGSDGADLLARTI